MEEGRESYRRLTCAIRPVGTCMQAHVSLSENGEQSAT